MTLAGYSRKKGAILYVHSEQNAQQRILFAFDTRPKYQPGAEVHIHPIAQVIIPQVSDLALSLVGGNRFLLAGSPDIILAQPIDFFAPKAEHQRWFASGDDQVVAACDSIGQFLNRWVLPFIGTISTARALVDIHETNDDRIMKQKHWYVFVVAAYQILGMVDAARDLVLSQFGDPGPRKRYAALFNSMGIS